MVFMPSPPRFLRAEDLAEGERGFCALCRFEHGKDAYAFSPEEALRHMQEQHAWWYEQRQLWRSKKKRKGR